MNGLNNKKKIFVLDAVLLFAILHLKFIMIFFADILPDCIFEKYGLLCPSCGGTTCLYRLAIGDFIGAAKYNFVIFLTVIYIIFVILILNLRYLFGIKKIVVVERIFVNTKVVIGIVIIYAVYGILRNFL